MMFDGIAPTYDTLNRVLSLGIDQSWRKKAVRALDGASPILDLCAGTLDLSECAEAAGAQVVAADFSAKMLQRGKNKVHAPLVQADAMRLPFADGSFAGILCGFGLRNLPDALKGLREMRRVAPRLVVLDFFRPRRTVTRLVQNLYNNRVLPFVGGVVSGDRSAYQYLAESIQRFLTLEEACELARSAGFTDVRGEDLTAGIAALMVCKC
jgi:demethylmenaquinone methyltransferase/2-methoxy-6-polyprenyl-1,4-benzoquinol methylase